MKVTCCDTPIEECTHCPECGMLVMSLDTRIGEHYRTLPMTLDREYQKYNFNKRLVEHTNKCPECTAIRFFYRHVLGE